MGRGQPEREREIERGGRTWNPIILKTERQLAEKVGTGGREEITWHMHERLNTRHEDLGLITTDQMTTLLATTNTENCVSDSNCRISVRLKTKRENMKHYEKGKERV